MDGLLPFRAQDYGEVLRWYEDPTLDAALGPLDRDWLEAVLGEDPPAQFVLWRAGAAVALVGVARPKQDGERYVVTDLAVRPDLRGTGLGRAALDAVLRSVGPPDAAWAAYVMENNAVAHRTFERAGWKRDGAPEGSMQRYLHGGPGAHPHG